MKKYGIIAVIVAAIVLGVFAWRTMWGTNDSMASSLPSDITAVGSLNCKALVFEYGLSWDEAKKLIFEENEEEKTGINFMSNAYMFVSRGYLGAIIPLEDNDEFKSFLQQNGLNVEEQRGLQWSVINDNILFAFNDDRAMLMGPAVGAELDNLRNTIAKCINQKASESGKETRLYKVMSKRSEPINLAINLSVLSELEQVKNNPWLQNKVDLSEFNLIAGLTAKKEKLDVTLVMDTENEKAAKAIEKADDIFTKIDGDLFDNISAQPLIQFVMGLDGEDFLEMLRKDQSIRTAMLLANSFLDVDMILKSIDGDVSLTLMANKGKIPEVLLQAEVDNDKFMKNVTTWNDDVTKLAGLSFYAKDDHNGICKIKDGIDIYFTTHNKRLLISNNDTYTLQSSSLNDFGKIMKKEAQKNLLYASLDIKGLIVMRQWESPPYIDLFERLILTVPRCGEAKIELMATEGKDWVLELKKK